MAGNYAPNYYGSGSGATAAEIVAAIKADPELGTADGGLVSNAALSAYAMVGTNVVEDNLDGTFDISVRNGDNTANLVTFRYNPVTGNKTVIS